MWLINRAFPGCAAPMNARFVGAAAQICALQYI
jgi:hypothetical protein